MDVTKIKKIIPVGLLPKLKLVLGWWRLWKSRRYPVSQYTPRTHSGKKRLLFYDMGGLSYAGTQKSLQILAKYLNREKYEVDFMYNSRYGNERLPYFENSSVRLVDFDVEKKMEQFPYTCFGMKPHIFDIVSERSVDVLVAAGSGYPEFPVANFTNLPIIFINVFGSINPQKNIKNYLCISPYLERIVKASLPKRNVSSLYIQSERPENGAKERGQKLRISLGIADTDIVFGRIGRPSNAIFDPIGLQAFLITVKKFPTVHYIIMAPPPAARDFVEQNRIPNVHFLPPSGEEKDIWAFHYSIDVMAHFRKDGETQGLNISESMLAARPIISHVSTVWNAHLEFLDPAFSFIAGIDDVEAYAKAMEYFAQDRDKLKIRSMGEAARIRGEELFLINKNILAFEKIVDQIVSN